MPEKTHKQTQRASKGSHDTFVLLKYRQFFNEHGGKVSAMVAAALQRRSSADFMCYFCEIVTAPIQTKCMSLKLSRFLLDTAGHLRPRRGPDVARGPDVVHHCFTTFKVALVETSYKNMALAI